jgi:hypothetical protein
MSPACRQTGDSSGTAPKFRPLATNTSHHNADGEFLRLHGLQGILERRFAGMSCIALGLVSEMGSHISQ